MRSAQLLVVRAALLGAVLLSAGCFRPKILSGAYSCGDGGACPDNFVCNGAHLCVSSLDGGLTVTGGTGGSGTGGKGGTGGLGTGGTRDAGPDMPCLAPVANANCPSDAGVTGMCDPVCNKGCGGCFDKCSVNMSGDLTCNPLYVPPSNAHPTLGQACDQFAVGAANQSDDCAPGQGCLNLECGAICYQFCRTNADCPTMASCSRDAGGGNKFCDVPQQDCDPVQNAATHTQYSGCTSAIMGCYLSTDGLHTLCDCAFGGGVKGSSCTHSRDCIAGLVCYDPTGRNSPTCLPVCRLPTDGGTASLPGEAPCNGSCLPIANGSTVSTVYGFCNGP